MYDDHGYWGRHGWGHSHHGSDFWWGFVIGAAVASVPRYTHTVVYTNTSYYYAGGVYYQKAPEGYVIVVPPIGIVVEAPPADCEMVKVEELTYCYNRGSFYLHNSAKGGYEVVAAPEDAAVSSLPEESTVKVVNGIKYHVFLDVYYRPYFFKNEYIYVVTKI